jgi:hypothetical protein
MEKWRENYDNWKSTPDSELSPDNYELPWHAEEEEDFEDDEDDEIDYLYTEW